MCLHNSSWHELTVVHVNTWLESKVFARGRCGHSEVVKSTFVEKEESIRVCSVALLLDPLMLLLSCYLIAKSIFLFQPLIILSSPSSQ